MVNLIKRQHADRAKNDKDFVTCNFDLEAVLYSPLFFSKPIFYKRKLAMYNFTVYEVAKKNGFCYMWDETQGKRGANEIATCLEMFINNIPKNVQHLSLFSDNCPGQNRNCIVASMLYRSLFKHENLQSIGLTFLEVGHTHMECDSMHAAIENASRHAKIFIPNDWFNIVTLAKKKGEPYKVHRLNHNDFKNYKDYRENCMPNTRIGTDGSILNWKTVKSVYFQKRHPQKLFYKNEYWDQDYKELEIRQQRKGRTSVTGEPTTVNEELKQLYDAPLKIDDKKYKDLQDLCKDDVVPNLYHEYYKKLPHGSALVDVDSDDDDISLALMRNQIRNKRRSSRKN